MHNHLPWTSRLTALSVRYWIHRPPRATASTSALLTDSVNDSQQGDVTLYYYRTATLTATESLVHHTATAHSHCTLHLHTLTHYESMTYKLPAECWWDRYPRDAISTKWEWALNWTGSGDTITRRCCCSCIAACHVKYNLIETTGAVADQRATLVSPPIQLAVGTKINNKKRRWTLNLRRRSAVWQRNGINGAAWNRATGHQA